MISRKLGEKNLTIPVLYILQTEGDMNTSSLKNHLLSLLNPVGINLMPLENRNDTAIEQIIRNIISHTQKIMVSYLSHLRVLITLESI